MTDWAAIDAKRDQLAALRTVKPSGLRALDDWYALELTYTSNAIEGNALTRQETALVHNDAILRIDFRKEDYANEIASMV